MEHKHKSKSKHNHGILGACLLCCCYVCPITLCATVENVNPITDDFSKTDLLYNKISRDFDHGQAQKAPDLQILIDKVFRKLRCRLAHGKLNSTANLACLDKKCMNAHNVLQHAGYLPEAQTLTPESLVAVSVPVVSISENFPDFCSVTGSIPCQSENRTASLSCWIDTLLPDKRAMSEGRLLDLIKNLNLGQRSHTESTLVRSVYDFLGISAQTNIPRHRVPLLTTFILSKIIHGSPEEDLDSDIPNPEIFIKSLFDVTDSGYYLSDERLEVIASKLKIGNLSRNHDLNVNESRNNSDDKRVKRSTTDDTSQNETCWSLKELKYAFNIEKGPLNQAEFERLCPALIQQTFSGVCEEKVKVRLTSQRPSNAYIYGFGTLSVVIISSLSILGIVFLPLLNKTMYEHALQGFIALGVGTLCGDAMLHILPEGFSVQSDDNDDDGVKDHTVLWRALACLGAIYAYFLFEIGLRSFVHHRSNGKRDSQEDHDHSHIPDPDIFRKASSNAVVENGIEIEATTKSEKTEEQRKTDHIGTLLGLTPLAWMMLCGDSLHNFGDGLTIAAAFSQDIKTGVSTAIAIFCHEIPHELGDFAILLSTGMSFKRALFLNFLTAVICILGFYIGVPISASESARQWIFVVAAGMFLYVALADMLPELKHGKDWTSFVLQNLGMLVGAGIMILMALYEDAIKI